MLSKGINSYGYVASSNYSNTQQMVLVPSANYSWSWGIRCNEGVKQDFSNWGILPFRIQSANAQVSLSDICNDRPNTAGTVTFQSLNQPSNFGFFTQIYPISGEIGNSSAINFLNTPAVIEPELAISWGLYRAGPGNFGLTNQYEQYMYITDNHSQWMGDLIASNPAYGQQAFNRFVLPGAHDAGMFDPTWINNNLNALNQAMNQILNVIVGPTFGGLISDLINATDGYLPRFIEYAAFTQKEQVATMLNLGTRYFDFRPGKVASVITQYTGPNDTLYHQHSCIPGYPYISFLTDVLGWLNQHPTEIVVISLSTNGFFDDSSMDPTLAELEAAWAAAVNNTGSTLVIGDNTDLNSSYSSLISQQKRIIFLNNPNIGGNYYYASKYDTYTDAYATFNPGPIIDVLNGLTPSDQVGVDYTVVQVQGTCTAALVTNMENEFLISATACATDIAELAAACTDSNAASFLMSTKPSFDLVTYPWVYNNLNSHLGNDQLVVILNDFVDNGLADICKALSATHLNV